ncbi:MAG: iron chelate uptake ABC transporter family permease subunit, partial [Clostridium sp.]
TALVGPITFLGILVVNLSYEMMKSYKHSFIIPCSILISIIALVGGQFVVERILNYNSKISIIINFVGGIYFIYLLLKQNKN